MITPPKKFTNNSNICLLLVHHTRKQQAGEKFEMISRTNGLLGAADGTFLLYKDKRIGCESVLEVSGRGQPDHPFYLKQNKEFWYESLIKQRLNSGIYKMHITEYRNIRRKQRLKMLLY